MYQPAHPSPPIGGYTSVSSVSPAPLAGPSLTWPLRIAAALAALGFAAHAFHTATGVGSAFVFDQVLYLCLTTLGGVSCAVRAVAVRADRGAWIAMAIALLSSSIGDAFYNFAWAAGQVPFPSIADAFYLGFYPAAYVSLVLLARARVGRIEAGVWLDGAIVGLTLAAISAAAIFSTIIDATSGSAATVATTLAYPIGDLVLLVFVGSIFTMTGFRPGRPLAVIGAALLLWAAADAVYVYLASLGTYHQGTLLDAAWTAGALLAGAAAWQRSPARLQAAETLSGYVAAAVFTLVALGLIMLDHYTRLSALAIWLAAAAVVVGVVRTAMTFVERARALRRSECEALTDGLTDLGNRRRLIQDLEEALAPGADAAPRSLVFYDLNGFKQYNDIFGHSAGDALLVRLGRRLGASVAGRGRAYRLGGDEFCVLFDRDVHGEPEWVEATAAALSEAGERFTVTNARGLVTMPAEATTPERALQVADERMYMHKGAGRATAGQQARDVVMQILREHEPGLHEHLTDVADHAMTVARSLRLDVEAVDEIRRAAQLHDVGKIAIPREILHKAAPLDAQEWRFMRQHTIIGERILSAAPALRPVARLVRSSHERWDGSGYPDGLEGSEIPLGARIIAVCDAYDAMITDRPYRRAIDPRGALAELRACAGSQFDAAVVEAFAAVVETENGLTPPRASRVQAI
jgi:diguanylate cyclase (GGDEF)-like protein